MEDHEARRIKKNAQKIISEAQKVFNAPKLPNRDKIVRMYDIMTSSITSSRKHIFEQESTAQKAVNVQRENATLQTELEKERAIKNKLENLCNDLKKQNREIIEESKKNAELEQQRRFDQSEEYKNTITEIAQRLEDSRIVKIKQLHENENIKARLNTLIEHLEKQEEEFNTKMAEKEERLKGVEETLPEQRAIVD